MMKGRGEAVMKVPAGEGGERRYVNRMDYCTHIIITLLTSSLRSS